MTKQWKSVGGKERSFNTYEATLECKKNKISKRRVRELLEKECYAGWHHVAGPYGVREIHYYSTKIAEMFKDALFSEGKTKTAEKNNTAKKS